MTRNGTLMMALMSIFVAVGCGPARIQPVQGQVVFEDGTPAKELVGYIVLFRSPQHNVSATAIIKDDGSFVMGTKTDTDGATLGKQQVAMVRPPLEVGKPRPPQLIDERYAKFETSGLDIEVVPGKNTPTLKVERLKK